MTAPQIIRTVEQLKALDPNTWLLSCDSEGLPQWDWAHDYGIVGNKIFPLVVIASGDQIRAAQKALEEA